MSIKTTEIATILLVEDNPDDETLTVLALKENNIMNQIIVVRDGQEALDYLFGDGRCTGQSNPLPELVLLDLKLPQVSGFEVLKRIRSEPRTRLLPVVVFTSSKEERDMLRGYNLGCNSFVQKPVDFVEFSRTVREMGVYWLLLNERVSTAMNAAGASLREDISL